MAPDSPVARNNWLIQVLPSLAFARSRGARVGRGWHRPRGHVPRDSAPRTAATADPRAHAAARRAPDATAAPAIRVISDGGGGAWAWRGGA